LDKEKLFHLDAFRLSGPQEAIDLDLDVMLSQAPLLVEWADRIQEALPEDHLWIKMNIINDEQRDFIIHAQGERHKNLLKEFREDIYGS
jgi:tRNA threonylcarbamoyladenosine biosynthesis protein TsaE